MAYPQRYVEEERRRNGPKTGLPDGRGLFCPSSSLLVAHVALGLRIAPRASKLGQNSPRKSKAMPGTPHQSLFSE